MKPIFVIYIVLVLLIFGFLTIVILRNDAIASYQNEFFNPEGKLNYIPKKIFQCVQDKGRISPEFKENIEYLRKLNPDWKYTLFDDKDQERYIKNNFPLKMLYYYNRINPKYGASRADFFRYLLMYIEGGVYLDIKSAVIYPLSLILLPDDEYIISYWDLPFQFDKVDNDMGEYQQWHIMCRPRHPFLHRVISKVMENIDNYDISMDGVGKSGVLGVTGPIAYTRAIKPILNKYNYRIVENNDYVGLVYNNLKKSHINLFTSTHYSKIKEPIIINGQETTKEDE